MPSYTLPRARRLSGRKQFEAVYAQRVRESRGVLTAYALKNELGHSRMGLSVSRNVGTAVRRNRIKRLLREAFRSMQHVPTGYDLVVVVRPHEPLGLAEYQTLLMALISRLHRAWSERRKDKPTT